MLDIFTTFLLLFIINTEVAKNNTSFLRVENKIFNHSFFYYSCNINL